MGLRLLSGAGVAGLCLWAVSFSRAAMVYGPSLSGVYQGGLVAGADCCGDAKEWSPIYSETTQVAAQITSKLLAHCPVELQTSIDYLGSGLTLSVDSSVQGLATDEFLNFISAGDLVGDGGSSFADLVTGSDAQDAEFVYPAVAVASSQMRLDEIRGENVIASQESQYDDLAVAMPGQSILGVFQP